MHRSRVATIVIDCDDLEAGVRFWSGALGLQPLANPDPTDPYIALEGTIGALRVLLQRVPEPKTTKSRIHLDIETDDVEAEIVRLEALGGRRRQQFPDYWITLDPCGNELCVIPSETPGFPDRTRTWEP